MSNKPISLIGKNFLMELKKKKKDLLKYARLPNK